MRSKPDVNDEYDMKELKALNAPDWMVKCLDLNPSYTGWGPHEDYMWVKEKSWTSAMIFPTWKELDLKLDDLNEVVNFYFNLSRKSEDCTVCSRSCYNPETDRIADAFFEHSCPSDMRPWNASITQDEVQALVDAGRLMDFTHTFESEVGWKLKSPAYVPTAAEVNAWQKGRGLGHDAINRHILIRARATRLGVFGLCSACEGKGYVYVEPEAKLQLIMWLIHPRKGASRGVEVQNVLETDLPAVYAYLKEAAARNQNRFSAICAMP